MNQILATSNPTAKKSKTRKSIGPADIKTVVRVFAIAMLVFGVFMVGTGSYAIYKDNEANNSENTKPTISESLNSDGTAVILTVTHDKIIEKIEYNWNNGVTQTITGNGRKYIEQEIEIPAGTNILNVKAIDTQGQEISTQKEYTLGNSTGGDNTNGENTSLNLTISEDNKLKITANSETEIQYMTYKWDDGEEQRVDINATTIDQEIDVPMGTHNITVVLVDVNNQTTTKEEKVMGTTKPIINVETDDAGEYYLITITDEVGLQKVDLNIRGEEKTITVEDGKKELKYKIKLNDNDENRLEITAYNVDGITSDTIRRMADKTNR